MNKGKILKLAKGFRGRAKNCIRIARERVEKSLQYAFRDRKAKKRDMRALWITRINAGTRQYGVCVKKNSTSISLHHTALLKSTVPGLFIQVKYSDFINGLQQENIVVNRKILSELAANEPYSFKALVDQVRYMRGLSNS